MGRTECFLLGFVIGITFGILLVRAVWSENIDRWNEVTYKYSYCPYCGEELEYKLEDTK